MFDEDGIEIDDPPVDECELVNIGDGVWQDPCTGDLFDDYGNPITNEPPADDFGAVGFNEWGDPSWIFDIDANGNTIFEAIGEGGVYYAVYDAAGNFLGTVDDNGNVLSDPARASSGNRAARTISPQSWFGRDGLLSPSAISNALQRLAGGASPAQRTAINSALNRGGLVGSQRMDWTPFLIAGAVALGFYAWQRQRATT